MSKEKFQNTAEIADRFLMSFYTMAESETLSFLRTPEEASIRMNRIDKKNNATIKVSFVAILLVGLTALWMSYSSTCKNKAPKPSHEAPQVDSAIAQQPEMSTSPSNVTLNSRIGTSTVITTADESARHPTNAALNSEEKILIALKAAFNENRLVSRIRLQDELHKFWNENPPDAEELVSLITDKSAPALFRVYMAKVLCNRVKRKSFDHDETSKAIDKIRLLIEDTTESPDLRVNIANILTMVDQSDTTILAIAPLLSENDEIAAKAVSALCNTTNSLAVEKLYHFVANTPDIIEKNPHALAAALPPLSTTEMDVIPVIKHIIDKTDNFNLYCVAVQALMYDESTSAVLEAIILAHTTAPRFGERQELAEHLCRAAAKKHKPYFDSHRNGLNKQIISIIDDIIATEEKR